MGETRGLKKLRWGLFLSAQGQHEEEIQDSLGWGSQALIISQGIRAPSSKKEGGNTAKERKAYIKEDSKPIELDAGDKNVLEGFWEP